MERLVGVVGGPWGGFGGLGWSLGSTLGVRNVNILWVSLVTIPPNVLCSEVVILICIYRVFLSALVFVGRRKTSQKCLSHFAGQYVDISLVLWFSKCSCFRNCVLGVV